MKKGAVLKIIVLVLLTPIFWFLTIPAVLIWLLWNKTTLSMRVKNLLAGITALIFIILFFVIVLPPLTDTKSITILTSPANHSSIQASSVTIHGKISPSDVELIINNNPITLKSDGTFEYDFPLRAETNTMHFKVTRGISVKEEDLTINRIFTSEEITDREKAKADAAAKAKAAQDAYDNSKAGQLCKKHPTWTKDDCQKVADKEYWVGMTYDMLVTSFGSKPTSANPSNYGGATKWQWCWWNYTPSCFYDDNDDGIIDSYN